MMTARNYVLGAIANGLLSYIELPAKRKFDITKCLCEINKILTTGTEADTDDLIMHLNTLESQLCLKINIKKEDFE